MTQRIAVLWLVLLTAILPFMAQAQVISEQKRPKIGLVLSGGGARGIAHIGVLQWLEDHHIPVDYIAGTSMGGLVGGMYAMGKTPDEMLQIVERTNWDDVLSGSPAYDELTFRRKQDRRDLQNEIELGLKHGVGAATGLNPGHKIGLIFDRLCVPYSNITSFNELPLPLRVVATDMLEGKAVIIKDGPLTTALRATMAIPGVFTLVERDGKVLGDGGLVNNIPTDVAKQMGADIVIAVDIGTPLAKDRATVESLGGILGQSLGIALIESDRHNLQLANVIVTPDLGPYKTFDFYAAQELYTLGYHGAEANAAALEKYALNETEWNDYLAKKRAQIQTEIPVPAA